MTQAPNAPQAELVDSARAALARHEWRSAFDGLSAADAKEPLPPPALELLAESAWWTGQLSVAIEARERAFAGATKAGDWVTAVTAAINLARDSMFRLAIPVAHAWIKRAEQMLDGMPENPGHGWVGVVRAGLASVSGDNEESIAQATRAQEIAERLGLPDLKAFAMAARAAGLLARGDVEEGFALADEAAVAAISGELPPGVAGGVFCATIEACAAVGDVRRALEWTEAQDRWCKREGINGFPGMCRLFRSDVKRLHGAWPEAEAEAQLASVELRGYIPGAAGLALYQVGEIRLRRGDLPAAEEALLGAHALGQDTEPMLSLLRLAQGKTAAAVDSIRRALTEPGRPSWRMATDSAVYRLTLLPAQVEILVEAGDVAAARVAADELAALADKFNTPAVRANAASSLGLVALAEGKLEEAGTRLREAIGLWTGLDAPYEAARMRLALAEAYSSEPDRAAIEARTARDAFERLGAALDLRRAEAVVLPGRRCGGHAAGDGHDPGGARLHVHRHRRLDPPRRDARRRGVGRRPALARPRTARIGGRAGRRGGQGHRGWLLHRLRRCRSRHRGGGHHPAAPGRATPLMQVRPWLRINIHQAESEYRVGLDYVRIRRPTTASRAGPPRRGRPDPDQRSHLRPARTLGRRRQAPNR